MAKRTGERRTEAGRFDAFRLSARGEAIEGQVDAATRERLADQLPPGQSAATIDWRIEGGRDALERPMLTITLHGSVGLVCQRCLQPFAFELDQRSEILVARDESELKRLDAEEREVVLASAPLDALMLIEDELLLSLPFAPMHPAGDCPDDARGACEPETNDDAKQRLEQRMEQRMEQSGPSPFAQLAAIKRRPGRT